MRDGSNPFKPTIWKRKFIWIPEYVEDGNPAMFGWRWLTFGWYRWFEGHYRNYWRIATHNWDDFNQR